VLRTTRLLSRMNCVALFFGQYNERGGVSASAMILNEKPPQWDKTSKNSHTVLIIEDDDQFREFLADLLALAGFKVTQAAGGESGIEQFLSSTPHLVITDILMPGIDGLEVIKTIKDSHPEIPIVALASTHNKPHKQGFLSLALMNGADAVLSKPINMTELTNTLNRLLDENLAISQATIEAGDTIG
jgi:DNA-binding response OmpR family regulator